MFPLSNGVPTSSFNNTKKGYFHLQLKREIDYRSRYLYPLIVLQIVVSNVNCAYVNKKTIKKIQIYVSNSPSKECTSTCKVCAS